VLELSSFQLESTSSLQCASATVLNISDDHLDRYPSLHEYAHTKADLLRQTKLQVLNRDDVIARSMKRATCSSVTFGGELPDANQYGLSAQELLHGDQKIASRSALRIQGQHNAMNALAAVALVSPLEIDVSQIEQALATFDGLPHRMALVATVDNVQYIDDSKATNVGAVVAALIGLGRKAVLIAGGQGKGQDFAPLNEPVRRYARAVVLIGADAQKIYESVKTAGVPVVFSSTLQEAVTAAQGFANSGDAVLLSPACASLDMFRNYSHRSEVFANAVRELAHA
jgi:UDP-N-acetylmuramoylalanine--D-glutamate ligase